MYYPLNDYTHLHAATHQLLLFLAKLQLRHAPRYSPGDSTWTAYCQNYAPIKVSFV